MTTVKASTDGQGKSKLEIVSAMDTTINQITDDNADEDVRPGQGDGAAILQ